MKKLTVITSIVWIFMLFIITSWNQQQNDKLIYDARKKSFAAGQRYIATFNGDTALLTLVPKGSQLVGKLKFINKNATIDSGTIKGTIAGDTLLADYLFKSHDGKWYRAPIALLKRNHTLTLGVGQFEFSFGRTYFAKNIPVDYNKGKYVFIKYRTKKL